MNSDYFHFATIILNVAIYADDTSVTLEYEGKSGGNVDYVEFDTSAKISGFDDKFYSDGDCTIVKYLDSKLDRIVKIN